MSVEQTPAKLKIGDDCVICCNTFTRTLREPIECKACDYVACKSCVKKFLLQHILPKCMKCNIEWTDEFCAEKLGGFMNTAHRDHVKTILFGVEKARFPETMPAVERHLKLGKMEIEKSKITKEISEQARILYALQRKRAEIFNNHRILKNGGDVKVSAKQFIRACPVNTCEGFLSSAWKCGVCETWACSKCFEIIGKNKNVDHVCDENVLKSAEMIKASTKPCPSCSSAIYKISGCDQMWCTQCKVAFSWKTGKQINGTIHNPHYYQWMKNSNNGNIMQPGAELCGGLPNLHMWRHAIQTIPEFTRSNLPSVAEYFINRNTYFRSLVGHGTVQRPISYVRYNMKNNDLFFVMGGDKLDKIIPSMYYSYNNNLPVEKQITLICPPAIKKMACQLQHIYNSHIRMTHFIEYELNHLRRRCQQDLNNEELRIQFITDKINEKDMKTQLIKKDRKNKKENKILQIYELFSAVGGECLRDMTNNNKFENLQQNMVKLERVRKYCNEEILKHSKTYNQVVPCISRIFKKLNCRYRWKKQISGLDWEEKWEDTITPKEISDDDLRFMRIYYNACIHRRNNRF